MSAAGGMEVLEWLFLGYFVCVNGGYFALYALALGEVRRQLQVRTLEDLPRAYSGLEPPVSILVPA